MSAATFTSTTASPRVLPSSMVRVRPMASARSRISSPAFHSTRPRSWAEVSRQTLNPAAADVSARSRSSFDAWGRYARASSVAGLITSSPTPSLPCRNSPSMYKASSSYMSSVSCARNRGIRRGRSLRPRPGMESEVLPVSRRRPVWRARSGRPACRAARAFVRRREGSPGTLRLPTSRRTGSHRFAPVPERAGPSAGRRHAVPAPRRRETIAPPAPSGSPPPGRVTENRRYCDERCWISHHCA